MVTKHEYYFSPISLHWRGRIPAEGKGKKKLYLDHGIFLTLLSGTQEVMFNDVLLSLMCSLMECAAIYPKNWKLMDWFFSFTSCIPSGFFYLFFYTSSLHTQGSSQAFPPRKYFGNYSRSHTSSSSRGAHLQEFLQNSRECSRNQWDRFEDILIPASAPSLFPLSKLRSEPHREGLRAQMH